MMSTTDRLAYMANQIARELGSQCPDRPMAATRDHLRQFWDPRMRQAIVDYLDGGGEHLSDIARGAVALLRENAERAD
jgi:formate dehydrogenase subunit delta